MIQSKDLTSLADLTVPEIERLFELAQKLKKNRKTGSKTLEGKSLGCIFFKPSTRTAVSFSVGMYQLGGQPLMLSPDALQIKRGESFADTARTLSRYLDGILIRADSQRDVLELAQAASIPVLNGLSDLEHPCQVLSDLFTLMEWKKFKKARDLSKLKVAYFGDGNNMANSWILAAALLGIEFAAACPEGYDPDPGVVQKARKLARRTDFLRITRNPEEAAQDADVLYTDVWASMGKENERNLRIQIFAPFQVTRKLLSEAKKNAVVMHCLPAHRGEEIEAEVMDGPQSIVFDQAENRLYVQKALLAAFLGPRGKK